MCIRRLAADFSRVMVIIALTLPPLVAQAGAKIQLADDADVDIGFRLHTWYVHTQQEINGDDQLDPVNAFTVRRGRFRLQSKITDYVNVFLQTEVASTGDSVEMRMIDAWIRLRPLPYLSVYLGEWLAPSNRLGVTSSATLLTIDRPGMAFKSLTWGTRARSAITYNSYNDSDAGIRGAENVRDLGAVFFGHVSGASILHFKYYLGVFDGRADYEADAKASRPMHATLPKDTQRYTGRLSVNLFDSEPDYIHNATYLGKIKTIALGFSADHQPDVDFKKGTDETIDYTSLSLDLFVEYPIGPGSATLQGCFTTLDLGGAEVLESNGKNARQSTGSGYFAEGGYLIADWQPWFGYEVWNSDAIDDQGKKGTYWAAKLGINYYIKGFNAKVSAGFEHFQSDANIDSTNNKKINTGIVAFAVTY